MMEQEQREQAPTLEEQLRLLEEVVNRLEREEISLEESFRLYHKGMDLLKQCNETIDTVEKQVLMLDENGETHGF